MGLNIPQRHAYPVSFNLRENNEESNFLTEFRLTLSEHNEGYLFPRT